MTTINIDHQSINRNTKKKSRIAVNMVKIDGIPMPLHCNAAICLMHEIALMAVLLGTIYMITKSCPYTICISALTEIDRCNNCPNGKF